MKYYQSIYEINTRVWIRQFDTENNKATLKDIPLRIWDELAEKGINYIWLMGIWKNCPSTIQKYCFEENLVWEYKKALKDFDDEDVIGSPYSICEYEINPVLGSTEELKWLRMELKKRDLKLILDFVPNHFSADTNLIETHPEIFLQTDEENYVADKHTYYKPENGNGKAFAHARDPFFPAWQDTIQLNYFSEKTREFMISQLVKITNYCDGVRCDMAMLVLNNVFRNTWGGILNKLGYDKPEDEFWKLAISIIKDVEPNFLFIAEAYWDLEWELQQLGFDYTYDKKLTDRLKAGYVMEIRDHLLAKDDFQNRSLRFIENHDEDRAVAAFGKERSKAAAVIISTLRGMRFYHNGQFEGKKIKVPVQLGRPPHEKTQEDMVHFYNRLLDITKSSIFRVGTWSLLKTYPVAQNDESFKNILAWEWKLKDERRLITVNYEDCSSRCRIILDLRGYPERITLKDLLTGAEYVRSSDEVYLSGLFIELKNFQSHIFAY